MIEAEWLACTDPKPMLVLVRGKVSERKLRLFAAACCRNIWDLLRDKRCRQAVEVAERFADGQARLDELAAAERSAGDAERRAMSRILELTGGRGWHGPLPPDLEEAQHARGTAAAAVAAAARAGLAVAAERAALQCVMVAATGRDRWEDGRPVQLAVDALQCDLLRDIFGNPFHPATLDSAWLTWNDAAVVRLAHAAYEERHLPEGSLDNSRLAVLADALEEAGCADADILDHLRGPGTHVRGCWPIDLCLGKS